MLVVLGLGQVDQGRTVSGAVGLKRAKPPIAIDTPVEEISITGGEPGEVELVLDAIDRFSELQLGLPELDIDISTDPDGCKGHSGLFSGGEEPWHVELCEVETWVVLHELGHAWTMANLDELVKEELTETWGLASWNDPETQWRERASERAADSMAWGLLEDPVGCHSPDGPVARRVEAFRQLTDLDAPRVRCVDLVPSLGTKKPPKSVA